MELFWLRLSGEWVECALWLACPFLFAILAVPLNSLSKGCGADLGSTPPIFTLAWILICTGASWTIYPCVASLCLMRHRRCAWASLCMSGTNSRGVIGSDRGEEMQNPDHSGRGKGWTAQISPSPHCQQTRQGGLNFEGRGTYIISGLTRASAQNRSGSGGYQGESWASCSVRAWAISGGSQW